MSSVGLSFVEAQPLGQIDRIRSSGAHARSTGHGRRYE